jgi:hypothetical protein
MRAVRGLVIFKRCIPPRNRTISLTPSMCILPTVVLPLPYYIARCQPITCNEYLGPENQHTSIAASVTTESIVSS